MHDRELQVLKTAIEYYDDTTKDSILEEIRNWTGIDAEEAFEYAIKKGLIEKSGKQWFKRDLWKITDKGLSAKEKWITVNKTTPVKLEEGKSVSESIKMHFDNVKKSRKYSDAKSQKKYKQVKEAIKNDIYKLEETDFTSKIFGYPFDPRADGTAQVILDDNRKDLKEWKKADKEHEHLDQLYYDAANRRTKTLEEYDRAFDKAVERFDHKGRMKDRQILADAYNDYMEETIKDKSTPIYRFVEPVEAIEILEKGRFYPSTQKTRSSYFVQGEPDHKSWTLNRWHRYATTGTIRLEATVGDYDFKILKATPYPRLGKSMEAGQSTDMNGLGQKELRHKIGNGVKVKNLTIHLPKDFFEELGYGINMPDKPGYTEEYIKQLIEDSHITVKTDDRTWRGR